MQNIVVVAVQGLAIGVAGRQRVDGVLGLVGAKPDHADDRPLEVVVAIDTDGVGVHQPAVGHRGKGRQLGLHHLQRLGRRILQRLPDGRVKGIPVEPLSGLQPDPVGPSQHRPIGRDAADAAAAARPHTRSSQRPTGR